MSYQTETYTFNLDSSTLNLLPSDKLEVKLVLLNEPSPPNNDFTSSISAGSLTISSLTPSIGYVTTTCPYLATSSLSDNELKLTSGTTNFHDSGYIFTPNPLSGSLNPLYSIYGDVDYPFIIKPFDIILLYLNDGTYVEYRVLSLRVESGELIMTLDLPLSSTTKTSIANNTLNKFLILTRIKDETNASIIYKKRSGKTSYGFIIPDNLSPEVLAKIDTITREVKQKLINEQQTVEVNSINTIDGGEI
jgi:cold shock CspA family protein